MSACSQSSQPADAPAADDASRSSQDSQSGGATSSAEYSSLPVPHGPRQLRHPETDAHRPTLFEIQRALIEHGYSLTADGRMGPDTKAAIQRFQRKQGLSPSGLADTETMRRLGISVAN